ncbi:microcystin degradation protein MlrC [Caldalkalibacillus uzonensis]|uniref:Microcystin degradation protein MlrC n=1 Tax=Caldalkalibacillus uzonensis TaxID=353224 RepID=A0ABU0CXV2_9BACI|nr:M81 family metallopeptidase [Caldalkalibacillus uzonensis]MDQ0340983.1 microcystin degradation protein MlrC [Caldalkalibacillus uzonensis]
MKIAIGGISHETNTFSNVKTTVGCFKQLEWECGQEIIENHTGVRDYLGGIIAEGNEQGVELVPTFWARANPSGTITRDTYDQLLENLLTSIIQVGNVDGICLVLHGGGIAEGIDDVEGDILSKVRQTVGDEIPIVATLDLHANLTETMIKEADALFGVNFYPHIDCFERGQEALGNLLKIIKGELKPVMHVEKLPMMLSSSTTDLPPTMDINEICWAWEKNESVIDCTFFHGFSQTDIPDMRVSVLTITDNNRELAEKISKDVAEKIWERRHDFYINHPSPKEGLEQALQEPGGPIVINETSDNPGAGTPGDGTHLLKAMIEMNIKDSCFGFICDPETVEVAHQSGVGTYISVRLGGKTDSHHGEPLAVRAYVKALTDGQFIQSSEMNRGKKVNLGKSVRLRVGNVDIIVCAKKGQTLDEQIFLLHGIDVTKYKIVALKSENHFRAVFTPLAKKIITVDSPGLSSYNLLNFKYQRVRRPVLPLDKL